MTTLAGKNQQQEIVNMQASEKNEPENEFRVPVLSQGENLLGIHMWSHMDLWLHGWGTFILIFHYFYFFEVVWQIGSSLWHSYRYWQISSIQLPHIDVKEPSIQADYIDGTTNAHGIFTNWRVSLQHVFPISTCYLIPIVAVVGIGLSCASLYGSYFQNEFVMGCTRSYSGTTLSNEVFAQPIKQLLLADINSVVDPSQLTFQAEQREECLGQHLHLSREQTVLEDTFKVAQAQSNATHIASTLIPCFNITTLDTCLRASCFDHNHSPDVGQEVQFNPHMTSFSEMTEYFASASDSKGRF